MERFGLRVWGSWSTSPTSKSKGSARLPLHIHATMLTLAIVHALTQCPLAAPRIGTDAPHATDSCQPCGACLAACLLSLDALARLALSRTTNLLYFLSVRGAHGTRQQTLPIPFALCLFSCHDSEPANLVTLFISSPPHSTDSVSASPSPPSIARPAPVLKPNLHPRSKRCRRNRSR